MEKMAMYIFVCMYIYIYIYIPKKKTCQKAKWLYEEALQTAMKIGEAKGKGENERYIYLSHHIYIHTPHLLCPFIC